MAPNQRSTRRSGAEPSKGWLNPIKVYATKQASGYTYSTAARFGELGRRTRPAPVPSAGAVESFWWWDCWAAKAARQRLDRVITTPRWELVNRLLKRRVVGGARVVRGAVRRRGWWCRGTPG